MIKKEITLLNPKETSEFIGITVATLAVWRTTKRYNIPYIKVGRLIKYRERDLIQWLEQRTKNPESTSNV